MRVVPSSGQIGNQCKWWHLVVKFGTKLWTQYPGSVVPLAMFFYSRASLSIIISYRHTITPSSSIPSSIIPNCNQLFLRWRNSRMFSKSLTSMEMGQYLFRLHIDHYLSFLVAHCLLYISLFINFSEIGVFTWRKVSVWGDLVLFGNIYKFLWWWTGDDGGGVVTFGGDGGGSVGTCGGSVSTCGVGAKSFSEMFGLLLGASVTTGWDLLNWVGGFPPGCFKQMRWKEMKKAKRAL